MDFLKSGNYLLKIPQLQSTPSDSSDFLCVLAYLFKNWIIPLLGRSFSKWLNMKTRVFVILALKNVSLPVD